MMEFTEGIEFTGFIGKQKMFESAHPKACH